MYRHRIYLSSAAVLLAAVLLVTCTTFFACLGSIDAQVDRLAQKTLLQFSAHVDNTLYESERLILNLVESDFLGKLLRDASSYEKQSALIQFNISVEALQTNHNISQIYLLDQNRTLIASTDDSICNSFIQQDLSLLSGLNEDGFGCWSCLASQNAADAWGNMIYAIRISLRDGGSGYLCAVFNQRFIEHLIAAETMETRAHLLTLSGTELKIVGAQSLPESAAQTLVLEQSSQKVKANGICYWVNAIERAPLVLVLEADDSVKDSNRLRELIEKAVVAALTVYAVLLIGNLGFMRRLLAPLTEALHKRPGGGVLGKRSRRRHHESSSSRKSLMMNYSATILLPILLIIWLEFYLFFDVMTKQLTQFYRDELRLTAVGLGNVVTRVDDALNELYLDHDLLLLLTSTQEESPALEERIHRLLTTNPEILCLNVYDTEYRLAYSSTVYNQAMPYGLKDTCGALTDGVLKYSGSYEDVFHRKLSGFVKKIRLQFTLDTAGYLWVGLDQSTVERLLSVDSFVAASFLLDGEDVSALTVGARFSDYPECCYILTEYTVYKDMRLLSTIEKTQITRDVLSLFYGNFLIIPLAALFGLLLAYVFMSRSYLPMELLGRMIGNLKRRLTPDAALQSIPEDVSHLRDMMDYMERQIETLAKDISRAELRRDQAQLYAMQSQIDTHFLFNVLDAIRWKSARLTGTENEVVPLIERLSEFLKLCVREEDDLVCLAKELDYAKAYGEIVQLTRTEVQHVYYSVEEEALSVYVPRMLLQPLVENAFTHARREGLIVLISGNLKADVLTLKVADNGGGMTQERLAQVRNGEFCETSGHTHIGLCNIRERLKLYYGDAASLCIDSGASGTTVRITLPCSVPRK